MELKKTFTALALAGVLAAALSSPALATPVSVKPGPNPTATGSDKTSSIPMSASVNEGYTVVVPETIDFGTLTKDSVSVEKPLTVKIKDLMIRSDDTLKVRVWGESPGDDGTHRVFEMRASRDIMMPEESIAYKVQDKDNHDISQPAPESGGGVIEEGCNKIVVPVGGYEFAAVKSGGLPNTEQDVSGKIIQTGAVKYAGEYADTLTFDFYIESPASIQKK